MTPWFGWMRGQSAMCWKVSARPGHFDGVLTVVAKMLHLTAPDRAYFGQKDAQQLWLISQMVRDLDIPVEIVEVPTVRDAEGLALSSRNIYLVDADRTQALALYEALEVGAAAAPAGASAAVEATRAHLAASGVRVDYVELVDPWQFAVMAADGPAVLLVAAHVGSTRLIDNVRLRVGAGER